MALPRSNRNFKNTKRLEDSTEDGIYALPSLDDFDEEVVIEETLIKKPTKPKEKVEIDPMYSHKDHETKSYIDEQNKKIKPFGGNKTKVKHKAGTKNFDDRKNLLAAKRITTLIVSLGLLGMFGFGIKNTFWPAHDYTAEDIQALTLDAVNETGFPKEQGRAFVEQFIKAYLSIEGGNSNESLESMQSLSYFYSPENSSSGRVSNLPTTKTSNFKQKILIEPKVFEVITPKKTSAIYNVSALVKDNVSNTPKWKSFAVNVYYEPDTGQLYVVKGSPTIIPNPQVGNSDRVPDAQDLGNGQLEENEKGMYSTIDGFIKAYADSSVDRYDNIKQYITKDATAELWAGFDGAFSVSSNQNISKKVYKTDKSNEWKVDVEVTWANNSGKSKSSEESSGETFKGRYVMTVIKDENGKYFVTRFKPYLYIEKEKNLE